VSFALLPLHSFVYEMAVAQPNWLDVGKGFVPTKQLFTDPDMLYIAIGILGATVMPHNLYLHSAVIQTRAWTRCPQGRKAAIKYGTLDSSMSLLFAFLINASILILAGAAFYYGADPQRCASCWLLRLIWGKGLSRDAPPFAARLVSTACGVAAVQCWNYSLEPCLIRALLLLCLLLVMQACRRHPGRLQAAVTNPGCQGSFGHLRPCAAGQRAEQHHHWDACRAGCHGRCVAILQSGDQLSSSACVHAVAVYMSGMSK
jgi:hypothetical protein